MSTRKDKKERRAKAAPPVASASSSSSSPSPRPAAARSKPKQIPMLGIPRPAAPPRRHSYSGVDTRSDAYANMPIGIGLSPPVSPRHGGVHTHYDKYRVGGAEYIGLPERHASGPTPIADDLPLDMSESEFRLMASNMTKAELIELCVRFMSQTSSRVFQQHHHRKNSFGDAGATLSPSVSPQHRSRRASDFALSSPSAAAEHALPGPPSPALSRHSSHVTPATVLEITELMTSGIRTEFMMERVVKALRKLLHAEQVSLYTVDPDAHCVVCTASSNAAIVGQTHDLSGIIGVVINSKKEINVAELANDWRHDEADSRLGLDSMESVLASPVRDSNGATIGMIECLNHKSSSRSSRDSSSGSGSGSGSGNTGSGFSRNHEGVLKTVCSLTSLALMKARLERELAARQKQTLALHRIAELTAEDTHMAVDRAITKVCQATTQMVNADLVSVYMVDEEKKCLVCHSMPRSASSLVTKREFPLHEGIVGHMVSRGQLINIADAKNDWHFKTDTLDEHLGYATVSILAVPVVDSFNLAKTMAVIEARNKIPSKPVSRRASAPMGAIASSAGGQAMSTYIPFTKEDEELLTTLANTTGSILRQAVLYEEASVAKEQMEILQNITEMIAAEDATEKVVRQIIDQSYRLVQAERISFFLVEDKDDGAVVGAFDQAGNSTGNTTSAFPSQGASPRTIPEGDHEDAESDASSTVGGGGGMAGDDDGAGDGDEAQEAGGGAGSPKRASSRELRRSFSHTFDKQQLTSSTSYTSLTGAGGDTPGTSTGNGNSHKEIVCKVSLDPNFVGTRIPWGAGIVGHVAKRTRLLNIKDAYNDVRFDNDSDKRTNFRTESILTVPVTVPRLEDDDGEAETLQTLAVIQAINKKSGGSFNTADEQNLSTLASSAGLILRKSLLLERAERARRRSKAMMELLKVSSKSNASLEEVIVGIVQVAYQCLHADRVTIFFADHNEQRLYSTVSKDAEGWHIPMDSGIAGSVATSGESIIIDDAYSFPKFDRSFDDRSNYRTKSVLCAAVKEPDGPAMAVVQALNKKRPGLPPGPTEFPQGRKPPEDFFVPFNEDDLVMLEAFCAQIRSTIRRYTTDALLSRLPADDRAHSLIELYNNKRRTTAPRFRANISLSRQPTIIDVEWPHLTLDPHAHLRNLQDTSLHVFDYTEEDLLVFSLMIFEELDLLSDFQIPVENMRNFLGNVRVKYNKNPFHNWYHGFSVFHFSYMCLKKTRAREYLTSQDVLSLLVGSLCHDIDHPGNTNTFEVNSSSQKALVYNDISVLENHHAFTAFTILRDDRSNILAGLDGVAYQAARTSIIEAILATDMTRHFADCKKLGDREPERPFDKEDAKERQMLLNMLIHSSDLSGQVFPLQTARVWEERISMEFSQQASSEAKLGLPVAPFMENLDDLAQRGQLQVKFIDFVLLPWWSSIERLLPQLRPCVERLRLNRRYYENLSEGLSPEEAAQEPEPVLNSGGDDDSGNYSDDSISD